MARVPYRIPLPTKSARSKALSGSDQLDSSNVDTGFVRSELGREMLVEVLSTAARVLRGDCERMRLVQPSDAARTPSIWNAALVAPQVGIDNGTVRGAGR
jgi:hypothetical protein